MLGFILDYYILVTLSSFGVIQIASGLNKLNCLLLFRTKKSTWLLGIGLPAIAFFLFFFTEERNINDYEGGLDANMQSLLFFLGASTAYGVTLSLSCLLNRNSSTYHPDPREGLISLNKVPFSRAVSCNLKYWRREWRRQIKPYLFG